MTPLNIIIMASNRGYSIQALIQEITNGNINAKICCIVSNKLDAPILQTAKTFNIPTFTKCSKGIQREQYDRIVIDHINTYSPNLILMVGYMRILSRLFVTTYLNKILNIHPSLLPKHSGLMDLDVHQSVLNSGDKETGCTIHFATEKVDSGQHLLQLKCNVDNNDTAYDLKQKVQQLESKAWIQIIKKWAKD